MTAPAPAKSIRIRGQVQGVGFRPFVWQLAAAHGVSGDVRNDAEGVLIHAEGIDLDAFINAISAEAPPLSRIDAVEVTDVPARGALRGFEIAATGDGTARTRVTPDAVICAACAAEVRDRTERRFGYPFANCTHCGPRFTIIEQVPYDRASTTMRAFAMCDACRSEYEDPANRRFHAQPIACADCGPTIWIETVDGEVLPTDDPIRETVRRLGDGEILAIKGLGGFHLACDARNDVSVQRLRDRKRRPSKPLALMAKDIDTVRAYATVSDDETKLLHSAAGPIVLLSASGPTDLSPAVAPNQWALGWMLPTTPLHLLLMDAMDGPLVMTSGNLSGEPQVVGNNEARTKLRPFVDGFVLHDRDIARRLDDSVARTIGGIVRMQRRARGYAPETLALPTAFADAPPVTAYGAFLKSSICLLRDGQALLSHHLGDLSDVLTADEFAKADGDYAALLDHEPAAIACDAHPDYPSTAHAEDQAARRGVPLIKVQHHHAHIAAAMAENGWAPSEGPVLGVALDGLGWGADETVWGGEWLLADYADFRRVGWLKPVPLPGGGAAQGQPWRNLLAQLDAAGLGDRADAMLGHHPLATLRAAVAKGINAPLTSSAGRLFDAVAAAVGIAPDQQSFEGEAAMALETHARLALNETGYPFAIADAVIDPAPMWRALLSDLENGVGVPVIAARFHAGLADVVCAHAAALADRHGAQAIALSGGCFQNATLLEMCLARLSDRTVLSHCLTPPNDGCVSLGQAVIAAHRVSADDAATVESN